MPVTAGKMPALLLRLLDKILRARIARRMKNLIGITTLDDFSAFHVQKLIGQALKKSDCMRNDHHRVPALYEAA